MEIKQNYYHKKSNVEKKAKVASWKVHPLKLNESLRR